MTWEIRQGDCIEAMRAMPERSIDAVVCDPPYGIGFMGNAWDAPGIAAAAVAGKDHTKTRERSASMHAGEYDLRPSANRAFQGWCEVWGAECIRVLKPGGHLLAFGGTRTYHRLTCAFEDAGFEIRDTIAWLYGSGFPKSLDVSKAIDKAAGAEREVLGPAAHIHSRGGSTAFPKRPGERSAEESGRLAPQTAERAVLTAPATPQAAAWEGWGTALKPAHEPIVVARKPFAGTVAANVLEHGTGALNVDACRVDVDDRRAYERNHSGDRGHAGTRPRERRGVTDIRTGGGTAAEGRWPANVVLDEEAAAMLDEQTGELTSGANPTRRGADTFRGVYGDLGGQEECEPVRGVDRGGASRFFYCAKASRAERDAGLPEGNGHPTVKPVELMRWLVRLVTPAGGTVLDPFAGSGTTGCAAVLEGFHFIGLEREPAYVALAEARIAHWEPKQLDLLGGAT